LHGNATAEAGDIFFYFIIPPLLHDNIDIVWLDETTLAVGRGFRTNEEGIDQLREAFIPLGVKVLGVHLPYQLLFDLIVLYFILFFE